MGLRVVVAASSSLTPMRLRVPRSNGTGARDPGRASSPNGVSTTWLSSVARAMARWIADRGCGPPPVDERRSCRWLFCFCPPLAALEGLAARRLAATAAAAVPESLMVDRRRLGAAPLPAGAARTFSAEAAGGCSDRGSVGQRELRTNSYVSYAFRRFF